METFLSWILQAKEYLGSWGIVLALPPIFLLYVIFTRRVRHRIERAFEALVNEVDHFVSQGPGYFVPLPYWTRFVALPFLICLLVSSTIHVLGYTHLDPKSVWDKFLLLKFTGLITSGGH